jgi:hypothetical protein
MVNIFGGKGVSWIWVVAAFLLGGVFKKDECECEGKCQKPCKDTCCP